MPPVSIPLSGRVPGRAVEPSRTRGGDGGGLGRLLENMVGYLGFSGRRRIYRRRGNSRWGPRAASPWAAPGGGAPGGCVALAVDLLAPELFLLGNNSCKL